MENSFGVTDSELKKLTFEELNCFIDTFNTESIKEEEIKLIITSICELALNGHNEIYKCAQLCLQLSIAYRANYEPKKKNQFKFHLLAHCREVFDKQKANFFRIYYIPQDDKHNRDETEEMTKLRLQPVATTMFFAELYIVGIMSCKIMEYFMKVFLDPVYINKITLECFSLLILKIKEKYCEKNGKDLLVELMNQVDNNCKVLKEHSSSKAKNLFQKCVDCIKDPEKQQESDISLEINTVAAQSDDMDYDAPKHILKNLNLESKEEITNVLRLIFNNIQMEPSFATFYANECYLTFNGKISVETIQSILEKLINENQNSALKDLLVIRNEQFEDLDVAKRIIGLVKFITDFYIVGFLSSKHIHSHIRKLLDSNLICDCSCHLTCIIMFSCGEKLYCGNSNSDVLQNCMNKIKKYCDNVKISSKTRFMVQKLNKLQKHWKTVVEDLNVGDRVYEQTAEKFCSIIGALTDINIDEILPQIQNLDMEKDTLKCLQFLFSMLEVNTKLGKQYSEVCKEMYKMSLDKTMLKMHVEDLAKKMILNYVEELKSIKVKSALGIANFLSTLYNTDILSTDFMLDIFEILTDSQKPCEAVLDLINFLLLTCGSVLNMKAESTKIMIYTDWVGKQLNEIHADALQKSINLKVKELSLLDTNANKSPNCPIYSQVLNSSYSKEPRAEPVVVFEEQELQQIVPKIDDINEFPPVLADKKKRKSQMKNTTKNINNPSELSDPSIKGIWEKEEVAEQKPINAIGSISSTLPSGNPLKTETSFTECFNINHEYGLEKKQVIGNESGSISCILNDLLINNLTKEILDKSIIDILKDVTSDPSSITQKVRDISISFCNKPIELQKKRDFILRRMIYVAWKTFSNTIFLAHNQLGYPYLIDMMDKIQRERNVELRKQLKSEFENALDLRQYAVSLVKFIGELVNFGILSTKVFHSIKTLLDMQITPIVVECFCELFKTVGLKMEIELGKVVMEECIKKLVNIFQMHHDRTIIFCPSVSSLIPEVCELRMSLMLNKPKSL
ncbi:unnamed protein product [Diamesa hyperborea]